MSSAVGENYFVEFFMEKVMRARRASAPHRLSRRSSRPVARRASPLGIWVPSARTVRARTERNSIPCLPCERTLPAPRLYRMGIVLRCARKSLIVLGDPTCVARYAPAPGLFHERMSFAIRDMGKTSPSIVRGSRAAASRAFAS